MKWYLSSDYNVFQFHLVRLKDDMFSADSVDYPFQFHLVRLKENQNLGITNSMLFQFHLVRLKVMEALFWNLGLPYFNSI